MIRYAGLLALTCWVLPAFSQELEILPVQGNIFMLVGAGANITAQVGRDGVILVDAGSAAQSDRVVAAVQKLVRNPNSIQGKIRYIVNTSIDLDHRGGNENVAKAGFAAGSDSGAPAVLVAHENALNRLIELTGDARVSNAALPGNVYTGTGGIKDLFWNDDGVQIIHIPNAHTDGDTIVYFRRADVVSVGDIFVTTGYPVIDLENGGSLQGVIDGLNRLLDITIPGRYEDGGTLIVPGHGRICDELDLVEYRDMLTIIRDRIQNMIDKGATLEQIKGARLTLDYDPEFGAGGPGAWPTDRFVEAAYHSLMAAKN
jgi:glyoxylase-like metal-dependent hydrolase (beta-lactamase superfamily II)